MLHVRTHMAEHKVCTDLYNRSAGAQCTGIQSPKCSSTMCIRLKMTYGIFSNCAYPHPSIDRYHDEIYCILIGRNYFSYASFPLQTILRQAICHELFLIV